MIGWECRNARRVPLRVLCSGSREGFRRLGGSTETLGAFRYVVFVAEAAKAFGDRVGVPKRLARSTPRGAGSLVAGAGTRGGVEKQHRGGEFGGAIGVPLERGRQPIDFLISGRFTWLAMI